MAMEISLLVHRLCILCIYLQSSLLFQSTELPGYGSKQITKVLKVTTIQAKRAGRSRPFLPDE